MNDDIKSFGGTAISLARNPLGIIALFIVLVYGFASLVTAFAGSMTEAEKLPLVYFLVGFPILVLGAFVWLVAKHSGKLFAPSDFKNEDNYVKMQLSAVASLAVAVTKNQDVHSDNEIQQMIDLVQSAAPSGNLTIDGWRNHVLWVDDRPDNNIHERRAFEAVGLQFALAETTNGALEILSKRSFAAIISDMGRREGPREGYVLLDEVRNRGYQTPFFFYAASNSPAHKKETIEHGGQGCTNNAQELFQMVIAAVRLVNKAIWSPTVEH